MPDIGISYLDQATQKGLGEAQLGNASGNYLLPDAQSIQTEAASFTSTPANQAISLIDGPAPNGYPIVNYEYAIVYSSQKDAATAQTIQAFLHWAVTDGNNPSFLDQVHFQPLPSAGGEAVRYPDRDNIGLDSLAVSAKRPAPWEIN